MKKYLYLANKTFRTGDEKCIVNGSQWHKKQIALFSLKGR